MCSETFSGGKNVYGVPLGVLMLQSKFPRIPGDVGNASTWPFPVLYRVVEGASPQRVVRRLHDGALLEPFVDAARELERAGTSLVTTNCGFLVLFQRRIQEQLGVPFVSSSLLAVPWLQALLPAGKRVGVLTIERSSLTARHLASAGVREDIPVAGMEEVGGYFLEAILGDGDELDVRRAFDEHRAAARLLVSRNPEVGAIVLECTNMPPYAAAIREETGLPVHDLTTLVGWLVGAHRRERFHGWT
jgi:Asp/Glu/hydantoin racemase